MRSAIRWIVLTLAVASLLSAPVGYWAGSFALHPGRRHLTPEMIALADAAFQRVGARREDFDVRANDGILLRGWIVYPAAHFQGQSAKASESFDWVLLFHGVSDNRTGDMGHAQFLLRAGYGVVMMDSRAHGESEGDLATYGWKERGDTQTIVAALENRVRVHCLFALGVSMGGAIALQSAAVEPRILGVAAESPFSSFREAGFDYAGFHWSPWLGRTLFRPAVEVGLRRIQRDGGFDPANVSPERAVAERPFPILLIGDAHDVVLPLRHQQRIYATATGSKQLWIVPGAGHATALGVAPEEYQRRVLAFFATIHSARTILDN